MPCVAGKYIVDVGWPWRHLFDAGVGSSPIVASHAHITITPVGVPPPWNIRLWKTLSGNPGCSWLHFWRRMKRHTSRNSRRDAKPKPSRNEDSDAVLRARTEEERRRRRRDWMIEQEKMDRHNRLKRKMAMEYEIRRARNMGLALPEGRCNRPRRSRSESPPSRCRRTSTHHTPEDTVLSKKFETSSGTTPLFKGSEGTKINPIELRKIKVDIHRNIPGRVATNELKRDIPNKEDVVLKRRAGNVLFLYRNFLRIFSHSVNEYHKGKWAQHGRWFWTLQSYCVPCNIQEFSQLYSSN